MDNTTQHECDCCCDGIPAGKILVIFTDENGVKCSWTIGDNSCEVYCVGIPEATEDWQLGVANGCTTEAFKAAMLKEYEETLCEFDSAAENLSAHEWAYLSRKATREIWKRNVMLHSLAKHLVRCQMRRRPARLPSSYG